MDFKDCIKYANENRTCYIATTDGDQPRVRAIGLWYADESGFFIQTQSVKAFAKQMEKNPKIEICFHSPEGDPPILRVYGQVKPVTDSDMLARCIEERPFLKGMGITKADNPLLAVFHLYTGEAYFWTGANSMKEDQIPRIKF